jgi:hypothetical protein
MVVAKLVKRLLKIKFHLLQNQALARYQLKPVFVWLLHLTVGLIMNVNKVTNVAHLGVVEYA